MTRSDINYIVTRKLNEFILKGYVIDTKTMLSRLLDASARIDMRGENDLVSIIITDDIYDEEAYKKADLDGDGIMIKIVRFMEPKLPIRESPRITIYRRIFIELGKGYYGSIADAILAEKIHESRMKARRYDITYGYGSRTECSRKYKEIALRWVRKQPGMENCTIDEIITMGRRMGGEFFNAHIEYFILARGNIFRLGAR